MEKGCILPQNELAKISREGNMVLESLSRFCDCSKAELLGVLQERNEPPSDDRKKFGGNAFGYKKYRKKINNKRRELREPTSQLKRIQETIKERLMCIPVSLSSTAGKKGDSAERNAEMHRYNPYLITLDIKSAYPSIDTHRVFKCLEGALGKPLDIWAPLLETPENKKLFIEALTHLCVSENELPQGAPTSNQIQNIVMRGFDTEIEKKLPELSVSGYKYSRYADDLTISYKHHHTKDVLEEQFSTYQKILESKNKTEIKTLMETFPSEVFNVTDDSERKWVRRKIEEFKKLIEYSPALSKSEKYQYIGILNTYKQRFRASSRRIDNIQEEIIKLIGNEGRTINLRKVKTRTPQSNDEREINGICFDKHGKKSLNRKKQSDYKRLFGDLLEDTTQELYDNAYYRKKFKMNECNNEVFYPAVIATLKGMYNRIKRVYGAENVPTEFTKWYEQAIKKRENYPARKEANQEEIEKRKQKKLKKEEEKNHKNNGNTPIQHRYEETGGYQVPVEDNRPDNDDDLPF